MGDVKRSLKEIFSRVISFDSTQPAIYRESSQYEVGAVAVYICKARLLREYQGFANLYGKLYVSMAQLILNLYVVISIGKRQIQLVHG